jgi:hypothetical protein
MEVLIFGIANLIYLAIFLGLTFSPAIAIIFFGRKRFKKSIVFALAAVTVVAPILWAVAGYLDFKSKCSLPSTTILRTSDTRIKGFLFERRPLESATLTHGSVDMETLISQGEFEYINQMDSSKRVRVLRVGERLGPSVFNVETSWESPASLDDEYRVREIPLERISRTWEAPIYLTGLEIIEPRSNQTIARATEWVFGGGILGPYLRLIGHDQDYDHLACGYISEQPTPWRPTLVNRPEYAKYFNADRTFLSRVLIKSSH